MCKKIDHIIDLADEHIDIVSMETGEVYAIRHQCNMWEMCNYAENMPKTTIKTSRNCLEGYLTEQCATCPYWENSEDVCGCCCPFPIMECQHYVKMYNEREGIEQ